jgi:hypothetical protein
MNGFMTPLAERDQTPLKVIISNHGASGRRYKPN